MNSLIYEIIYTIRNRQQAPEIFKQIFEEI